MVLGNPSSHFLSDLRFEAYIVNAALGGATTSRLYQSIRENRGLAYNVYSSLHSFTDAAQLLTYIGTSPDQAEECLELYKNEWQQIASHGLTDKDIDYYKTQVMGQILLGSDDIENRVNSIAINEMVYGKYKPVDDIVNEIESVNKLSVQKYIDNYFHQPKSFLAMGSDAETLEAIWAKTP
jgi:predicted Zn-dependent peptidase